MPLTPDDISRLDDRAKAVGRKIGWDLRFVVAPNPEYVGVTAGPEHVFVLGPAKLADLAAHDIELDSTRSNAASGSCGRTRTGTRGSTSRSGPEDAELATDEPVAPCSPRSAGRGEGPAMYRCPHPLG